MDKTDFFHQNNFNPHYTFDRWIVGSSNRVTFAAARKVADNLGQIYNPLFIYGGVGLGKIELLHTIVNHALRQHPELTAHFVSSQEFAEDLRKAKAEQKLEDFHNSYLTPNILLVDDFQLIADSESIQKEFHKICKILVAKHCQIIIASDRPPKAIHNLDEQLREMLENGFITDLQMPDFEMRLAILRAKSEYQAIPVPSEVVDYIGSKIESNLRELEDALIKVIDYALHKGEALTVDIAEQALEEIRQNTRHKIISSERIIEIVSRYFGLNVEELKNHNRKENSRLPRQIAMYIIREHTKISTSEIGQLFAGQHSTTVRYAYDKIQHQIENDVRLRQQVNTITQILYLQ